MGTGPLQIYENRKILQPLDFLKKLYKAQLRIHDLSNTREITRAYFKNPSAWNELGTDPLQIYEKRKVLQPLVFLKKLCKGQLRIRDILYMGQFKWYEGDNKVIS